MPTIAGKSDQIDSTDREGVYVNKNSVDGCSVADSAGTAVCLLCNVQPYACSLHLPWT